jgi:hypothetical protein
MCAQDTMRACGETNGRKSVSETHRDRVGVLEPVHPNVPLGRHLAAVPLRARLVNDETIADCAQENRGRDIAETNTEKSRTREIEPSRSKSTGPGIAYQLIGSNKKATGENRSQDLIRPEIA